MATPTPPASEVLEKAAELEACPFCGGAGSIEEAQGGQAQGFTPVFRGHCSEMDCANTAWGDREDAIKAWNRRAPVAGAPVAWLYRYFDPGDPDTTPEIHMSRKRDEYSSQWSETPLYALRSAAALAREKGQ